MKRCLFFLLFILPLVGFSACSKDASDEPAYIKVAIYDGTPQLAYFTDLLSSEWVRSGHRTELRIVPWDNYDGLPDEDASLLVYDGVFYSALKARGLLRPFSAVPERCSFDWTYALADSDRYAVPFLLCSSFLLFDGDDAAFRGARYVSDVAAETAVPLRSMCAYYYIANLIAGGAPDALDGLDGDLDVAALAPLQHMYDKWLGGVSFGDASLSRYDGPGRFNGGSVGAVYNFSETVYDLSSDNLSAVLLDPFPDVAHRAFNVDYLSVRSGISKGAAALCEDLVAIISSEEFQYAYLSHNGEPLYSLPANKAAFARLAAAYPLYATFYDYSASSLNRPMVLGPSFYEQQTPLEQKVRTALQQAR